VRKFFFTIVDVPEHLQEKVEELFYTSKQRDMEKNIRSSQVCPVKNFQRKFFGHKRNIETSKKIYIYERYAT